MSGPSGGALTDEGVACCCCGDPLRPADIQRGDRDRRGSGTAPAPAELATVPPSGPSSGTQPVEREAAVQGGPFGLVYCVPLALATIVLGCCSNQEDRIHSWCWWQRAQGSVCSIPSRSPSAGCEGRGVSVACAISQQHLPLRAAGRRRTHHAMTLLAGWGLVFVAVTGCCLSVAGFSNNSIYKEMFRELHRVLALC